MRKQLDRMLAFLGPEGLYGIRDIGSRRMRFQELIEAAASRTPSYPEVSREDCVIEVADGPDVAVRVYRPEGATEQLAAVMYLHGGGLLMGDIGTDDSMAASVSAGVGCLTVSVDYRLAPEHPYPAALDDVYAVLCWLVNSAPQLGVDAERVGLYGTSAGGGLAAALSLYCRDRSGPAIAHQLLIAPMLDDRSPAHNGVPLADLGVWDAAANAEAWASILVGRAGRSDVPPYAAPARAESLGGLPPTYIEVGDLDLFLGEDVRFALRLAEAGVPVELHVYPGAYHGFESLAPSSDTAAAAQRNRQGALRRALGVRPE
jgi:acetyl esterase/lipase